MNIYIMSFIHTKELGDILHYEDAQINGLILKLDSAHKTQFCIINANAFVYHDAAW